MQRFVSYRCLWLYLVDTEPISSFTRDNFLVVVVVCHPSSVQEARGLPSCAWQPETLLAGFVPGILGLGLGRLYCLDEEKVGAIDHLSVAQGYQGTPQ